MDPSPADNADAHWRTLHLVRPAAADPAFFNLAAVNTRLRLLGDDNRSGDERRAYDVIRVEITTAERQIVFEHANLARDEREQIAAHATARELPVYLPEALDLARNLAKAANRVGPGPLQRCLERLSGRFQRHAYAWLQLDREITRSVKDDCSGRAVPSRRGIRG